VFEGGNGSVAESSGGREARLNAGKGSLRRAARSGSCIRLSEEDEERRVEDMRGWRSGWVCVAEGKAVYGCSDWE